MTTSIRAETWLAGFREQALLLGLPWQEPLVGWDEGVHTVSMDWWNGEKALGVYVTTDEIFYIRDWGANIETEMEDGDPQPIENQHMLLNWLWRNDASI